MCGKAAVSHLSWKAVFAWAHTLTPPLTLPADPISRVNISPSRLRRKSEPDSMVWETLPLIHAQAGTDQPDAGIWPFLPGWAGNRLPQTKDGQILSTANARLRPGDQPFAPTFMPAWRRPLRVVIVVSWFYEFDARVKPQVPYAVFPLEGPCWFMAGLGSRLAATDLATLSVAVITVDPNQVLQSVGHHRSPALLRTPEEVHRWLHGSPQEALALLRPYPDEAMGVEAVPMNIKIPGNENIVLPEHLQNRSAEPA